MTAKAIALMFLLEAMVTPSSAWPQVPAPLSHPSLSLMTNGWVDSISVAPDGSIVLGGSFSLINGVPRANIARLLPDHSLDPEWNPGADDEVRATAIAADGTVYAGGIFHNIGGAQRAYLAKLAGSGSGAADATWNAHAGQWVYALATDEDGVYAAGRFQSMGGTPRQFLARLSADSGDADADWDPSPNAEVYALSLDHSGSIYAAGAFKSIGGESRTYVAKLSTANGGAADHNWNAEVDGVASAVIVDAVDHSVFVGAGRVSKHSDSDGSADTTWSKDAIYSTASLALDGAGWLYVGGGDVTIHKVATTGTGQSDPAWKAPLITGSSIYGQRIASLAIADGNIVAGGYFTGLGAETRLGVGFLSPEGAVLGFADAARPGAVHAIAREADGSMIVGGDFFLADAGVPRGNVLRLDADGQLDPVWNPKADGTVYAVAIGGSGAIYIGGAFWNIGRETAPAVARVSGSTGEVDPSWTKTYLTGNGGEVLALAVDSDERIYVGGSFFLARLESSGALDSSWNPHPDGAVNALAIDSSGNIYAGGSFVAIDGIHHPSFARFLPGANTIEPAWGPYLNGRLDALAFDDSSGQLYVGGRFNYCDEIPQGGVARIPVLGSGAIDATWQPKLPIINFGVRAFALSQQGNIYIAATQDLDPWGKTYKISTMSPGNIDLSWHPMPTGGWIDAISVSLAGNVVEGGNFTRMGGTDRLSIVAVPPEAPDKIFVGPFE